jgi:hypothetical protein
VIPNSTKTNDSKTSTRRFVSENGTPVRRFVSENEKGSPFRHTRLAVSSALFCEKWLGHKDFSHFDPSLLNRQY